ncbi:hypothetical protein TYRP_013730 [Tyrophagus putrescentiae]|nr:hypothetical protein TYRP_013730 [Tyrophagus putrescentiae]
MYCHFSLKRLLLLLLQVKRFPSRQCLVIAPSGGGGGDVFRTSLFLQKMMMMMVMAAAMTAREAFLGQSDSEGRTAAAAAVYC